jgi:pyruvate formate lyase activating enzyme
VKIAGLIKTSLCDFSGHLSCVIFTEGCNLRCPYCHNYKLIGNKNPLISEEEILKFVESRRNLLDSVVISGGEPCLQSNLIDFVKKIKKMGFLVKLDTNGSYPDTLETLLEEKLIDYVAMDIKSPLNSEQMSKITGINYHINKVITKIAHSIKLLKKHNIRYEFRTTLIKEIHSKDDILEMAMYGENEYKLQQFHNENINDNEFKNFTTYSLEELETICSNIHKRFPSLNINYQ